MAEAAIFRKERIGIRIEDIEEDKSKNAETCEIMTLLMVLLRIEEEKRKSRIIKNKIERKLWNFHNNMTRKLKLIFCLIIIIKLKIK